MKLTSILLTIFCIHASAGGFTQTISLSFRNAPLEIVIKNIEKQSNFYFVYNPSLLKMGQPVTIQTKNAALEDVLILCFKDQPFTYAIINKMIVLKEKSNKTVTTSAGWIKPEQTPPTDIKGSVVNDRGEPLADVTVTIKGTSVLTRTNSNGDFTLTSVDQNAILVFTHISMETLEVKLGGKTNLKVSLKDKIRELGGVEVVSTGYQDLPKERATGSFSKVGNESLNQQTSPNVLDRLKDVSAGILFDYSKPVTGTGGRKNLNFNVRGLSTINGPVDPLIVLDNFIYEGDINNINPNDIESVTILKDAAAASIWGARAGNGVVVITTKKGKFNQKMKIEFNSSVMVTRSPDLFSLPQMSTSDFIDVETFLFNKGFRLTDTADVNRPPLTPVYEILLKRRKGQISTADSASQIDALKAIDSRDEFNKHLYQDAITQQYALNLRGGSANVAWLISGGFNRSVSALQATYNKANIRIESSYKPFKNVQFNTGVYYTNSKSISGAPGYKNITVGNKNIPYLRLSDEDGNALAVDNLYREIYTDTAGAGRLLNWKYYPLEDYKHDKSTSNIQEIIANVGINIRIFKNVRLNANYQNQRQSTSFERRADMESFYTRDLINKFTVLGSSPSSPDTFNVPKGDILEMQSSTITSQNFRGQLDYNQSWNNHDIFAIAGSEIREVVSVGGTATTLYGYVKDPLSYGIVDFKDRYKTFVNGNFANIPGSPFLRPTNRNRFVSVYANATYIYKKRYSASISGRKDASNIFGLSTNDKWTPLWSFGLGWEASKEAFYKIDWLPYLKVRATLGYSGNVDASQTAMAIAGSGTSNLTNYPFLRISTLNNPSLRWEKSKQLNIGIDFSLENQVISGSLEYYKKKGVDLYGPSPYDYTAWGGSNSITKNVANMEGDGLDVQIRSKNINRTIKWNTTFLFNYNANKTTAYFEPSAESIYGLIGRGDRITPMVGMPLYAIAAYKWGGLNSSGDPQGYLDGQLSTDYAAIINQAKGKGIAENVVFTGSASPKYYGSLINEINWKGVSLSFNIAYKFGHYFRKPTISYNDLYTAGDGHKDFEKRWQKPGDESNTNIPSMVYTNYPQFSNRGIFFAASSINVLKADHIRFQYINLAYSVTNYRKSLFFETLQLYINAANLGLIWRANKEGIDPEYSSDFSPSKQYTFGIRGNF